MTDFHNFHMETIRETVLQSTALLNTEVNDYVLKAMNDGFTRYKPNGWADPENSVLENDLEKALGHINKSSDSLFEIPGSGAPHLAHAITRLYIALYKQLERDNLIEDKVELFAIVRIEDENDMLKEIHLVSPCSEHDILNDIGDNVITGRATAADTYILYMQLMHKFRDVCTVIRVPF